MSSKTFLSPVYRKVARKPRSKETGLPGHFSVTLPTQERSQGDFIIFLEDASW